MPPRKLTNKNAEAYLNAMLQEAGLPAEGFDLERGWEVLIAFCNTPMNVETDSVSLGWEMRFGMLHYSILRQFNGDRSIYTHLHIEWQFDLEGETTLDELRLLPGASGEQEACFREMGCDIEQLLREEQQTPFHHRLKRLTRYQSFVYHDLI
jgi:hypothetical protein